MSEFIKKDDALKCCRPIMDKHGNAIATSVEYMRIRKLEPVDVRPVVRGKWETHILDGVMGARPRTNVCSHCLNTFPVRTSFCPNCGADMKGENHD